MTFDTNKTENVFRQKLTGIALFAALLLLAALVFWRVQVYASAQRMVSVEVADGRKEVQTVRLDENKTVSEALRALEISLGENDETNIPTEKILKDAAAEDRTVKVSIKRVRIVEETEEIPISPARVWRDDPEMFVGEKKIIQKGRPGKVRITQLVRYENDQETARTEVERQIVESAQNEIILRGTKPKPVVLPQENIEKLKLGKKHKGQASWYRHKKGMFAANPWLPMGSRVKVTNRANGKSVVVVINDRGPFVPGRIIDLEKTAFEQIASLGTGVIDVVMHEIKD